MPTFFFFKTIFALWHGCRLAAVLTQQFFTLLCGRPAAKRFLKGLILSLSLLNELLLWKLILTK